MYLEKRTYVKRWQHDKPEDKFLVTVTKGGDVFDGIDPSKVSNIIEEVGYWRKANHIHKWFVDNVQGGEDDCKEHYVARSDLKALLDICNKVIESSKLVPAQVKNGYTMDGDKRVYNMVDGKVMENTKVAEELLPCQEGFFFGGTDYDEYYYNDIVETKNIIEEALKSESGDFYYQSSW